MSFEDAYRVVHRHPSSDPFNIFRPAKALVEMRTYYQERDAHWAVVAAAAAARVVRPPRPAGGAPNASGRPKSKTKPSRAPPAAARRSADAKPRGRSRDRKVVMYQAMCFIAYDS